MFMGNHNFSLNDLTIYELRKLKNELIKELTSRNMSFEMFEKYKTFTADYICGTKKNNINFVIGNNGILIGNESSISGDIFYVGKIDKNNFMKLIAISNAKKYRIEEIIIGFFGGFYSPETNCIFSTNVYVPRYTKYEDFIEEIRSIEGNNDVFDKIFDQQDEKIKNLITYDYSYLESTLPELSNMIDSIIYDEQNDKTNNVIRNKTMK